MLTNPYIILGAAGAWLLSIVLVGWLMYSRGHDDMRNAFTEQQLNQANLNLKNAGKNNAISDKSGKDHAAQIQVVHDTTREIVRTVTLPPSADVFLPVGFVRMLDRAASRNIAGDPYPGKSDGDPSDVKVSEAQSLLGGIDGWADDYYTCRKQVIDTANLKPILPPPPETNVTFLDKINPF